MMKIKFSIGLFFIIIIISLLWISKYLIGHEKSFVASREGELNELRLRSTNKLRYTDTVHFLWCNSRSRGGWFEFRHYLSVLGAIKFLNPNSISFHYDEYPYVDKRLYNTWLDEIVGTYPFFIRNKLPSNRVCFDAALRKEYAVKRLNDYPGVFLNINSIVVDAFNVDLLDTLSDDRLVDNDDSKLSDSSIIMESKSKAGAVETLNCTEIIDIHQDFEERTSCLNVSAYFYPTDICHLDSRFGRRMRNIFYGNPEIPSVPQSYQNLSPYIVHVIWFHGGVLSFMKFLSLLSAVYVGEVDAVYIHGDIPFTGKYAQLINKEKKIHFVKRTFKNYVFNQSIPGHTQITDVIRVDILDRYGGIYMDTDAIMVKPLTLEMRSYDAVINICCNKWNYPFPTHFQIGIMLGKAGAKFWRTFQQTFKKFRTDIYAWSGNNMPYKLWERDPRLVHVDKRLAIECYELKCRPTYWPNCNDMDRVHHLSTNSIKNWRNDTYFFHWTWPEPSEYDSPDNLIKNKQTLWGQIGMEVLYRSKYYEYFTGKITN